MHGCAPRAGGVRSGGGCDCRPVSFWWRRPRNLERSHDVAGPAADPSESLVISVSLRHPGQPHCHASGPVVEYSVRRPPLRTGRGQASLGMPQRGGSAKRGLQRDLASFLTLIGKNSGCRAASRSWVSKHGQRSVAAFPVGSGRGHGKRNHGCAAAKGTLIGDPATTG